MQKLKKESIIKKSKSEVINNNKTKSSKLNHPLFKDLSQITEAFIKTNSI